jgi:hypothetical protein
MNKLPTCSTTGHRQYKNQSQASIALQGLQAFSKGKTDDLHEWLCPECGYYHVGHFTAYINYLERMDKIGQLDYAR